MKLDAALSDMVAGAETSTYKDAQEKESNIIVAMLSDHALPVVRFVLD